LGPPLLVGNDVVDLDDPAIATHHVRDRFVHRVCHESERAELARADDPKTLLWSLFAAKEAAFKIVAKLDPKVPFAHSQFVVAKDLSVVVYRERSFSLRVETTIARVHAVASSGPDRPLSAVERADDMDASVAARELLCRSVAARIRCVASELEIVRAPLPGSWTGYGPPELVFRDGRALHADVSLSHDGRFVACAAHIVDSTLAP